MTLVNQVVAPEEQHAPMLMGLLLNQVRTAFAGEDWGGLRQSHFRVMSSVPRAGISITDLGERVGMTKQGCGQFVSSLVDTGHLKVEPDPADRRTRVVKRTPLGNRTVKRVNARIHRLEQVWATQVGEQGYRTFRQVLEQLADTPT
jgi:DNA-binding MarR family transcriptional regulator